MAEFDIVVNRVVVPELFYPFEETCNVYYFCGYFVGTSFRRSRLHETYNVAYKEFKEHYEKKKGNIYRVNLNLQKL